MIHFNIYVTVNFLYLPKWNHHTHSGSAKMKLKIVIDEKPFSKTDMKYEMIVI